ncbi:hypothetical protein [Streptomyces sp. VRA16 Mangrove soil]|uniref:hypothetical protein n=1 Tax=Streptomyces sp. VRA16 Mangrove soil TaxID=2817434 RepID=UPI001A9F4FDD|nr:hypothetical protein [Streptomyces sp. VRA16 Mangrove soil]MBO1337257.1 hypothetical protein [Streptomyces sp. VRA16 Mangrove soil]
MWPGQQPPGGEQNPQDANNPHQPAQQPAPNPYQQPGYQQPNPYQQQGYQQPNPYQQQPSWNAPTTPLGGPQPSGPEGSGGGGGGNTTKWVAIGAAVAVVVAAGVTGFLVLGGDKDDDAKGGDSTPSASQSAGKAPSASASETSNPRDGSGSVQPTVSGWKVVVNPKRGVAFDVPSDWEVGSDSQMIGFEDVTGKKSTPLILMSAPAFYKSKWCGDDEDKDGTTDYRSLAAVGTKGAQGAKDTDQVAVNQVGWWVFGAFTQPDKKSLTVDKKAEKFTTASGIEGSVAWARSKNTPQKGKCASDGRAITFGFQQADGDYAAWSLYAATGVKGAVSDKTIMKILSTVRLYDANES